MRPSLVARLIILTALLMGGSVLAQIPAFDFYPEFRTWWFVLPDGQHGPMDAVIERYKGRLRSESVNSADIARRIELIRNQDKGA